MPSLPKQNTSPEVLAYDVQDAARVSGVSRSALYEAMAEGRLAAIKHGRRTLIMREALLAFLAGFPAREHRTAA